MLIDVEEENIIRRFNVLRRIHLRIGLLAACLFMLGGIFLLATHVDPNSANTPGILLPDKHFIAEIAPANSGVLEVYEPLFTLPESFVNLVILVPYFTIPFCLYLILFTSGERRSMASKVLGAAAMLHIGIGWQQGLQSEPVVFATSEAVTSSNILSSGHDRNGSYRRDALKFVEAQLLWNDGRHAAARELASTVETGWFNHLGSIGDDRLHLIAGRVSSMRPVVLPLGIRLNASSIIPLRITGWTLLGCAMALMVIVGAAGRAANIRERAMVSRLQRLAPSKTRVSFNTPQGNFAA